MIPVVFCLAEMVRSTESAAGELTPPVLAKFGIIENQKSFPSTDSLIWAEASKPNKRMKQKRN